MLLPPRSRGELPPAPGRPPARQPRRARESRSPLGVRLYFRVVNRLKTVGSRYLTRTLEASRASEKWAAGPRGSVKPVLLFFTRRTSGPGRRMESLIAHVARKERRRLTVVSVDADANIGLAEKLAVTEIP